MWVDIDRESGRNISTGNGTSDLEGGSTLYDTGWEKKGGEEN